MISKGLVIHGATETHPHPTKLVTFSVPVSSEMAPTFKLVAMIVSPVGELVADSVTIPVQSFNRYKVGDLIPNVPLNTIDLSTGERDYSSSARSF